MATNYWRVQVGAFTKKANATALQQKIKNAGFSAIIKHIGSHYKVQVGAFTNKSNADKTLVSLKSKGFDAFITYDGIMPVDGPKKYLVGIDAGHGSNTAGKRTPDGYREHWINVHTATYFDMALKRCGIDTLPVAWNRDDDATNDEDISLGARQNKIKNAGCDISVSWHANALGYGESYNSANGIGTYYFSEAKHAADSKNLAKVIQNYLIKGTKQKDRGINAQPYAMCNCTYTGTKASVLLEIAFMTNKDEAELLMTDEFCYECAEEATQGVCEYLGVKYVPGEFKEIDIKIGSYNK